MDNQIISKEDVKEHLNQIVKYLCQNHHPHTFILVECDRRQLLEGIESNIILNHIID